MFQKDSTINQMGNKEESEDSSISHGDSLDSGDANESGAG